MEKQSLKQTSMFVWCGLEETTRQATMSLTQPEVVAADAMDATLLARWVCFREEDGLTNPKHKLLLVKSFSTIFFKW